MALTTTHWIAIGIIVVIIGFLMYKKSTSPAASPSPTNDVTLATLAPTIDPSGKIILPTMSPTMIPTMIPTMAPTMIPTIAPTMAPTIAPTMTPTMAPTIAPTTPTMAPTMAPTASPSTAILNGYISQLAASTQALTNATQAKIINAYGQINGFFIAGQATPPPMTGLTQIGTALLKNSTNECATKAPSGATLFIYNPLNQMCSYYSGSVRISNLQTNAVGTSSGNMTIGSTLF